MFCTGDTVILEDLESEGLGTYRSKLVEYTNDTFIIEYPIHEVTKKLMIVENGRKVKISVVTKDQRVFEFGSKLLGRKLQQIPVLVFSFPGEKNTIQIQRRKYVRVETFIDVKVQSPKNEFVPFSTTTVDISAGGMAIRLPHAHTFLSEREISLQFKLGMRDKSVQELHVAGIEVNIREIKGEQTPVLSVEFKDIHERERQALVRYCFDQQLLLRQKR
ncbi:flagellar brake protein [Priestia taiwanensis]|uniref:Pilus assembly protein PilZ n=1 Tax=Priestia taiwanensis TaxID=1347902 RepID=A0A917AJ44_9BACI|nr:flagellar brake domain-containing protein [Priestia taiwanensis]MBM7361671.1 c-di-GMP-binding flagellar brake protein YcgR [Priestia taiwanensis]GGE56065.1 hypothetical protein GCM10007140_02960 [Priestia taiwanensis]